MSEKGSVLVIGSGAAGNACARTLARSGWRVTQIERDRWGGTCAWRGCIPKKSLYRSASMVRAMRDAETFGVSSRGGVEIDWQSVLAWKWHAQETYAGDQVGFGRSLGIELVDGTARFLSPEVVEVGDQRFEPDHIVIATGSEPVLPNIPGIDLADTSEAALRFSEIPSSMVIVGGGFIALEMAGIYASFGTKVSVVVRGERTLGMLDPDLARIARIRLEALGVRFFSGQTVTGIARTGEGLVVATKEPGGLVHALTGERVLMATGRRPAVADLDLEAGGVETDGRGHIVVDEHLRTTNPLVWAAGDAAGGMMQTPVANLEGRTVALSIDSGTPHHPDCSAMPVTCFTVPQLATVGLTEDAAREQGHDVKVTRVSFDILGAAIVDAETDCFVKLVYDAPSGRLLGAQTAGPSGSDVIYSCAAALRAKMTAEEIGKTIAVHPSFAEGVFYGGS